MPKASTLLNVLPGSCDSSPVADSLCPTFVPGPAELWRGRTHQQLWLD